MDRRVPAIVILVSLLFLGSAEPGQAPCRLNVDDEYICGEARAAPGPKTQETPSQHALTGAVNRRAGVETAVEIKEVEAEIIIADRELGRQDIAIENSTDRLTSCENATVHKADPSNIRLILDSATGCSIIRMAPGHYHDIKVTDKGNLTFVCKEEHKCNVDQIISVDVKTLIVKGMNFDGSARQFGGSTDYGIALYRTDEVRIVNNIFEGAYNHDISTKNVVGYSEILRNIFIECARHCIEVGQNGNVPSRPSTSGTMIVKGNVFDRPIINAITQRYNQTLIVDGNEFIDVGGHTVINWPFWKPYDYGQAGGPEANMIPEGVLRTEITNNTFTGRNRLTFEGRGSANDTILIKDNTGAASCSRMDMDAETADAHSNEETTAPPELDPASDVSC